MLVKEETLKWEIKNMNRRTFLKTVGVTIAAIATPTIASSKPQWIRYTDQMPKIGQNIISLSVSQWKGEDNKIWINMLRCRMTIGRIEVDDYDWSHYNKIHNQNVKNKEFALRPQAIIEVNEHTTGKWVGSGYHVHWERTIVGDILAYYSGAKLYQKHDIEKLEWVNPVKTYVYNDSDWKSPIYCMESENRYWMPITTLPKQLPEFPPFQAKQNLKNYPYTNFNSGNIICA